MRELTGSDPESSNQYTVQRHAFQAEAARAWGKASDTAPGPRPFCEHEWVCLQRMLHVGEYIKADTSPFGKLENEGHPQASQGCSLERSSLSLLKDRVTSSKQQALMEYKS